MEDIEIKKAYMIVIKDMKRYCQAHSVCLECELFKACDKTNECLYEMEIRKLISFFIPSLA